MTKLSIDDLDDIVRIASIANKPDENLSPDDLTEIDGGMAAMTTAARVMVNAVSKLLQGKSYCITTTNPETWTIVHLVAQHIGASVDECNADGWLQLTIKPPLRQ